jgi:hypothetical protein
MSIAFICKAAILRFQQTAPSACPHHWGVAYFIAGGFLQLHDHLMRLGRLLVALRLCVGHAAIGLLLGLSQHVSEPNGSG